MLSEHEVTGASGEAIEEVSRLQNVLLDAVDQAVIATDLAGAITYWNRAAEQLYGWRSDEVLGRNVVEVTPSDQSREQAAEIMRRLGAGERWSGEFLLRRRDGSTFPGLVTDAPIHDSDGRLVGVVGVTVDLTEVKRTEQALRASVAQVGSLYGSNVIGMLVATMTAVVDANDMFLDLIGYTRADLEAGRIDWQAITPPEYAPLDQRALAELMDRGAATPFEKEYVRKDGQRVPILLGASLLEREPLRWSCFVLDLRERRELEHQRAELLATLSHDLQQPLALIKGRAQLMRRQLMRGEALPVDRLADGLAAIESRVDDIVEQMRELLDSTRLELGQPLELHREETDLITVAHQVVEAWQAASERHRLEVRADNPRLESNVDPVRIRRVLSNLVSNAIKYSPEGGDVVITVRREDGVAQPVAVLSVSDQGMGIRPDALAHIFERFYRSPRAVGIVGGSGLGLASARQIVEQHGGSIEVQSVEGQGSVFSVRLPIVAAQRVPSPNPSAVEQVFQ